MTDKFSLPGASFEGIQKVIKGYSNSSDYASLAFLAKLTGLNETNISASNKFLFEIGLITGGKKKLSTDLGKKLGRALEHKHEEDIKMCLSEAVQSNEAFANLVTTVRIQDGVNLDKFTENVLYVSGQSKTSRNRTGARCLVDILISAGLLEEHEGELKIATPLDPTTVDKEVDSTDVDNDDRRIENVRPTQSQSTASINGVNIPQIAINIQLHLPETDNAEVYEKLFQALRKHLIDPKE